MTPPHTDPLPPAATAAPLPAAPPGARPPAGHRPLAGGPRVLWTIPAVYLLFVAGEFLTMTHVALDLTARGHSALSVGLAASSIWIGILLASTRVHRLVERRGHPAVFVGACAAAIAAVTSMTLHTHFVGWLAGAFAMGLAAGTVWVSGETWLAEVAPTQRRGFYVGLFETAVGLGMVTGPALLPVAVRLGLPPLGMSLLLITAAALCSLVLLTLRDPASTSDDGPQPASGAAPSAPAWRDVAVPLAGIAAISGVLEAGSSGMLPSVSMRGGFSVEHAALLGSVIGAGSALMQTPFGALADRAGMARTLRGAWIVLVGATGALWAMGPQPDGSLWAIGFVLGGVGGAVYTLVVIELGHRLSGPGLVRAMGMLVTAYTAGTALGPVIGGGLFDLGGLPALAAGLLVCSMLGLLATLRRVPGR